MNKFIKAPIFSLLIGITLLYPGQVFGREWGEFHALVAGVTNYHAPRLEQDPDDPLALDQAAKDMAKALRTLALKAGYEEENICITVLMDMDKKEGVGASPLCVSDLQKQDGFLIKLQNESDPISKWLKENMENSLQERINSYEKGYPRESLVTPLIKALNSLLRHKLIYDKARFAQIQLDKKTHKLLEKNPQGEELLQLNRLLLQAAYPDEMVKEEILPPTVHNVLNDLFKIGKRATSEKDTFVFYFTGHGSRDPEMFLYGSGADGVNDVYHIPFRRINDRFRLSNAGTKIIFIDACQTPSNPALPNQATFLGEDHLNQLKTDVVNDPQGMAIFLSSEVNQVSYIDKKGIGYFTKYLIQGLTGEIGIVGRASPNDDTLYAHKLKEYVREKIKEEITREDLSTDGKIKRHQVPIVITQANKENFKLYKGKLRALTFSELKEKIKRSIVTLEANYKTGESRHGTGFVVGENGYILTSKTILNQTLDPQGDPPEKIFAIAEPSLSEYQFFQPHGAPSSDIGTSVRPPWEEHILEDYSPSEQAKEATRVEPIGADPLFDFLLLQFSLEKERNLHSLKIGNPAHVRKGDKLFVAGFKRFKNDAVHIEQCSLHSKYTSQYVSWDLQDCNLIPSISEAPLWETSWMDGVNLNGSPILDVYGDVVGILVIKTENKETRTRFGDFKYYSETYGISYPITFANRLLHTAGISD